MPQGQPLSATTTVQPERPQRRRRTFRGVPHHGQVVLIPKGVLDKARQAAGPDLDEGTYPLVMQPTDHRLETHRFHEMP